MSGDSRFPHAGVAKWRKQANTGRRYDKAMTGGDMARGLGGFQDFAQATDWPAAASPGIFRRHIISLCRHLLLHFPAHADNRLSQLTLLPHG